jgi:hypothetical protein
MSLRSEREDRQVFGGGYVDGWRDEGEIHFPFLNVQADDSRSLPLRPFTDAANVGLGESAVDALSASWYVH